jgi:hypothetical protein
MRNRAGSIAAGGCLGERLNRDVKMVKVIGFDGEHISVPYLPTPIHNKKTPSSLLHLFSLIPHPSHDHATIPPLSHFTTAIKNPS